MRSALQAASENDKVLVEREAEVANLKTQLADLTSAKDNATELQAKVTALESEIESVSRLINIMYRVVADVSSSKRSSLPQRNKSQRPKKRRNPEPLMSTSKRRFEGSSTLSKNSQQRMQSSRRNTRVS